MPEKGPLGTAAGPVSGTVRKLAWDVLARVESPGSLRPVGPRFRGAVNLSGLGEGGF